MWPDRTGMPPAGKGSGKQLSLSMTQCQ